MSGKGGVGKTSVSVNLSIALANKGYKVGLIDVDIHGPDIPRMLGLKGLLSGSKNKKIQPISYSENLVAVSMESLMPDKDEAIIWREPVKHTAIQQFIGDVDWGDLNFLIIDSPPGTSGGEKTACETSLNFLGKMPLDPNMVTCGDAGISFQGKYVDSEVTKAFKEVAERMSKLVKA